MPGDVFLPFNEDVERHGEYCYTGGGRRSAAYVSRRFTEVILRTVALSGKTVVDVGCGDGTYSAELREQARPADVLGIDPAASAVRRAQERFGSLPGLGFRTCLAGDLVREGQRFDVAVYRGVIHHVGDPAAEIGQALRLAETVCLLEPNGWNPVLKVIERLSPYHRAHRERSFPAWRFRRWVAQGGGRVSSVRLFGLVPIFSPACFVPVGAALEPLVERLPGLRALLCGQMVILARRAASDPEEPGHERTAGPGSPA
jgi:SAM-dependent methyltransferase